MGWTEGKGLGKSEQGINTHIVAKKRKDEEGLGQEGALAAEMGDQWWAGSLEKTMYKMKMKKKMAKQAKKEEKKAKKEAEGGGGGEGEVRSCEERSDESGNGRITAVIQLH